MDRAVIDLLLVEGDDLEVPAIQKWSPSMTILEIAVSELTKNEKTKRE